MGKLIDWIQRRVHPCLNQIERRQSADHALQPAPANSAVNVTIQFQPAEKCDKADGNGALMSSVQNMVSSAGQKLSEQHKILYRKDIQTLKTVLQTAEDVRELREKLERLVKSLGMAAPASRPAPAEAGKPKQPVPVQDLDLVERIGMAVNDLRHVDLCLKETPDNDGSRTTEARARIQGLCGDIRTTLAMRDVHLIADVEKFDSIKHRPTGRRPRPHGVAGDGEVIRIGLTYKANGRERVLIPALVALYEDANT
jgi:hypothetical protein